MNNSDFTKQQLDLLRLYALYDNTKQVAEKMGISAKTVEYHIAAIYKKTNTNSRGQLIRYAVEHGFVAKGEAPPADQPKAKFMVPVSFLKNNGDLASSLLQGAGMAITALEQGKDINISNVNALCQCANSYINLARLQMDALTRAGVTVGLLPESREQKNC